MLTHICVFLQVFNAYTLIEGDVDLFNCTLVIEVGLAGSCGSRRATSPIAIGIVLLLGDHKVIYNHWVDHFLTIVPIKFHRHLRLLGWTKLIAKSSCR
jgi:hypothetical protein